MSTPVSTPVKPVTFAELVSRKRPLEGNSDLSKKKILMLKINMNCFLQDWTLNDVQVFTKHFLLDLSIDQLYNVYTTINSFYLERNYEHHLKSEISIIEGECTICLLDVKNGITYCLLKKTDKIAFLDAISSMSRTSISQYYPSNYDMPMIEHFLIGSVVPTSEKLAPFKMYFAHINIIGLDKLSYTTIFIRNLVKKLFHLLPFNRVAFSNNKYDITVNESCELLISVQDKLW